MLVFLAGALDGSKNAGRLLGVVFSRPVGLLAVVDGPALSVDPAEDVWRDISPVLVPAAGAARLEIACLCHCQGLRGVFSGKAELNNISEEGGWTLTTVLLIRAIITVPVEVAAMGQADALPRGATRQLPVRTSASCARRRDGDSRGSCGSWHGEIS